MISTYNRYKYELKKLTVSGLRDPVGKQHCQWETICAGEVVDNGRKLNSHKTINQKICNLLIIDGQFWEGRFRWIDNGTWVRYEMNDYDEHKHRLTRHEIYIHDMKKKPLSKTPDGKFYLRGGDRFSWKSLLEVAMKEKDEGFKDIQHCSPHWYSGEYDELYTEFYEDPDDNEQASPFVVWTDKFVYQSEYDYEYCKHSINVRHRHPKSDVNFVFGNEHMLTVENEEDE